MDFSNALSWTSTFVVFFKNWVVEGKRSNRAQPRTGSFWGCGCEIQQSALYKAGEWLNLQLINWIGLDDQGTCPKSPGETRRETRRFPWDHLRRSLSPSAQVFGYEHEMTWARVKRRYERLQLRSAITTQNMWFTVCSDRGPYVAIPLFRLCLWLNLPVGRMTFRSFDVRVRHWSSRSGLVLLGSCKMACRQVYMR